MIRDSAATDRILAPASRLHPRISLIAEVTRGTSDTVLASALRPFYSTKRSGAGLGLTLAREIVEALGGGLRLGNRRQGGLCAGLTLPQG